MKDVSLVKFLTSTPSKAAAVGISTNRQAQACALRACDRSPTSRGIALSATMKRSVIIAGTPCMWVTLRYTLRR